MIYVCLVNVSVNTEHSRLTGKSTQIANDKVCPVPSNVLWPWLTFEIHPSYCEQESPAIADKPARRESLPKIAPIRRAYYVVADNTGLSSFV